MLQIQFLGTGTSQGVPLIGCDCATCSSRDPHDRRLRPSIWLRTPNGKNIVVDIGPDFRAQALRAQIPTVDAVLITHEHRDHIGGLDDLRPYNFRQGEIPIFTHERTAQAIRAAYDYIFNSNYPGIPQLSLQHIAPYQSFAPLADDFEVLPLTVLHGQLPILGFRFGNFAYLTDTKYIPDETLAQLQNLDILVISALHYQPHHSHNTVPEAIEWAQKINARRTFFTHMSHYVPPVATAKLPPNIYFAYDGLQLFID